ncbi:MAG: hypothetical protein IKN49_00835 [Elusimicrobiaceae bacterium]|nr:hypothetical protein [Elusimicrobiaceae bacterium]
MGGIQRKSGQLGDIKTAVLRPGLSSAPDINSRNPLPSLQTARSIFGISTERDQLSVSMLKLAVLVSLDIGFPIAILLFQQDPKNSKKVYAQFGLFCFISFANLM